jgi:hypothetical protein
MHQRKRPLLTSGSFQISAPFPGLGDVQTEKKNRRIMAAIHKTSYKTYFVSLKLGAPYHDGGINVSR